MSQASPTSDGWITKEDYQRFSTGVGTRGSLWFTGTLDPTGSTPSPDDVLHQDIYLNTQSGDIFQWDAPSATWVPIGNLKGPAGVGSENDLSGFTMLTAGQTFVDVTIPTQPDTSWIFIEKAIVNTVDPTPLNIWGTLITSKTPSGFRMQLNAAPDTGNYRCSWTIRGVPTGPPVPATTYLISGAASGKINAPSTFTAALLAGTSVASPVTVTPSAADGTFSPTSVVLTTAVPAASFTYTPTSYGIKSISATNDGGLNNPSPLSYQVLADTYALSGPSSGNVGAPSTNFTIALPAGSAVIGTVNFTPNDGGAGGVFTPASVPWATGNPNPTFTYKPTTGGSITISTTNDGGLTDPAGVPYHAIDTSPHLLNSLGSYWKLDEAGGLTTLADAHSTHPLIYSAGSSNPFGGFINNCQYFTSSDQAGVAATTDFDVSAGSFSFRIWLRIDAITADYLIFAIGGANLEYHSATGFRCNYGSGHVDTVPVTVNTVIHLVCWYDSVAQTLNIRVNDATTYTASGITPVGAGAQSAQLGANASYGFMGEVDEIGLWKRILSAAEQTALNA